MNRLSIFHEPAGGQRHRTCIRRWSNPSANHPPARAMNESEVKNFYATNRPNDDRSDHHYPQFSWRHSYDWLNEPVHCAGAWEPFNAPLHRHTHYQHTMDTPRLRLPCCQGQRVAAPSEFFFLLLLTIALCILLSSSSPRFCILNNFWVIFTHLSFLPSWFHMISTFFLIASRSILFLDIYCIVTYESVTNCAGISVSWRLTVFGARCHPTALCIEVIYKQ